MAQWVDMEALENKNHASLLCFFDSLGAIRKISCLESASRRVVTHQHALSVWFQLPFLPIEHLGRLDNKTSIIELLSCYLSSSISNTLTWYKGKTFDSHRYLPELFAVSFRTRSVFGNSLNSGIFWIPRWNVLCQGNDFCQGENLRSRDCDW